MNDKELFDLVKSKIMSENDEYAKICKVFEFEAEIQKYIRTYDFNKIKDLNERDSECTSIFCVYLKKQLEENYSYIKEILPALESESFYNKIAELNTSIEEASKDESINAYAQMEEKITILRKLQETKMRYETNKKELESINIDELRQEVEKLEKDNREKLEEVEKKNSLIKDYKLLDEELEEISSEIEGLGSKKIVEKVNTIITRIKQSKLQRQELLKFQLDNLEIEKKELEKIEDTLLDIENIMASGLENIKITAFYPEFEKDQDKLNNLKIDILNYEQKLKAAILEKDNTAENLKKLNREE